MTILRLVVAFAVGLIGARLLWMVTRPVFATPILAQSNWRGRTVPTATGVVIPLVLIAIEAGRALLGSFGVGTPGSTPSRMAVLATVVGFALLGLLDDVAGGPEQRGFRGHLGAVARGRATTGVVKLVGGAALALAVVGPLADKGPLRLVADAALVALSANLANLLDRAPGRVIKVGLVAFVAVVAVAGVRARLDTVAVVIGASAGLLLEDLRERLMLGDTGANALGAVLGLSLVLTTRPPVRTIALVVVAALNLAGELVSFSRVIDAVPPLRALDRAGRRP